MKKTLMKAAALLIGVTPTAVLAQAVPAAQPQAQAPTAAERGFYRMKLGDFTVVALNDGIFDLATDHLLVDSVPGEVKRLLAQDHQPTTQPTSVNSFIVDTGSRRILVDTGSGSYFGPTLGFAMTGLKAAGYRPEDIDEILITHMHPDHIGGLTVAGAMAFPNATIRADKAELAFWLDKANVSKVDGSVTSSFAAAAGSLAPYLTAGRVKTFDKDEMLDPGIQSVRLPGHTIGHTGYQVQSAGKTMLIWGDVMHVASVQLKDPRITIKFDSVPAQALASRDKALTDAAKAGYLVAGSHMAFPGIGTIGRSSTDWTWTPVTTR
jgi:glyoxylase-like metal-dependent hydrolase (beta-lactamase superfamily II)